MIAPLAGLLLAKNIAYGEVPELMKPFYLPDSRRRN